LSNGRAIAYQNGNSLLLKDSCSNLLDFVGAEVQQAGRAFSYKLSGIVFLVGFLLANFEKRCPSCLMNLATDQKPNLIQRGIRGSITYYLGGTSLPLMRVRDRSML